MNSDSSKKKVAPAFLVEGSDYSKGCGKVLSFLEQTTLIKYDAIEFDIELSRPVSDPNFWVLVESALNKNRQSMLGLIDELQKSGYSNLSDLVDLQQGYESKVLHLLTHLLDGFIGVDSSFYNLIEDSHRISVALEKKMKEIPKDYWLLQVNAENLWTFL